MKTSTSRFSDRVDDYIKYRPTYPVQIIDILNREINFNEERIVADIGSGTGISSHLFIQNSNKVFAVEPNREMREGAESLFKNNNLFVSIDGTAEATTLPDAGIDLIFCGQAYHWFDVDKTKIEFARILKPGGTIMLAWNERSEHDPFQQEYDELLRDNVPEYKNVTQKNIREDDMRAFFSPAVMQERALAHAQYFNLEALKGRLRSSSYCPKEGEIYYTLMEQVTSLFRKYEQDGVIAFNYDTKIYWNQQ